MKKIVTVLLLFACLIGMVLPVAAATASVVPDSAEIDRTVLQSVGVDTPGAAVVVIESGIVLKKDGFGYANVPEKTQVTADTVFEIGDLSALFTATAAWLLIEQGRLDPDADIVTYLPAQFISALSLDYPVTTRQLLMGRAGFGARLLDMSYEKPEHCFDTLEAALLADVPQQILLPDTACIYSPFGMALAAFVVEQVAGVPYEQFVSEQVLTPLGMRQTVLCASVQTGVENVALGYGKDVEGSFHLAGESGRSYAALYPASGALSTAQDLALYFSWLLGANHALMRADTKAALLATASEGIFAERAGVFDVRGTVYSMRTATKAHGVSVAFEPTSSRMMLVLTNAADSTLLSLPQARLMADNASVSLPEGDMLGLKALRGTYAPSAVEQRTFCGKLLTAMSAKSVRVNDDSTLSFADQRLVQIARGVFADADGDTTEPLWHFVTDDEGEVVAIFGADGSVYSAVPFYYHQKLAMVIGGGLALLTLFFLFGGISSFIKYLRRKRPQNGEEEHETVKLYVELPLMLSAVLALCALVHVLIGYFFGAAVFSTAYTVMRAFITTVSIGATVSYVVAFLLTIFRRKTHKRIAHTAMAYLIFYYLLLSLSLLG
ncbi:MAG: beta-lactamase family protein [Clostridia bacterium]|nr:beta-lactamase family protein [Clostridia bacterium]MBQ9801994.1 beta-lactamase family protein [Clostridia bacterium]